MIMKSRDLTMPMKELDSFGIVAKRLEKLLSDTIDKEEIEMRFIDEDGSFYSNSFKRETVETAYNVVKAILWTIDDEYDH